VNSSAAKSSSASGGPQRHEEQRDDEEVRRGERREERRGEPPEDDAVPRVVDEVLRQVGEPEVAQAELVVEPAADRAPPRERHRVHVDQPECGDERRDGEHRVAQPRALLLRQVETAAEEVRADREQIVPRCVEDALVRGVTAEPRLRQHPVHDDEHAEGEREPVGNRALERQAAARADDEHERDEQQHVLPRRHHRQRRAAHAGPPQQRGDDVVQREADDQRVQRPHGPLQVHSGPTAISVIPVLITRTL
jgi:hypothetical protein